MGLARQVALAIVVLVLGVTLFFTLILTVLIGGNWLLWRFRKLKPPSEGVNSQISGQAAESVLG